MSLRVWAHKNKNEVIGYFEANVDLGPQDGLKVFADGTIGNGNLLVTGDIPVDFKFLTVEVKKIGKSKPHVHRAWIEYHHKGESDV